MPNGNRDLKTEARRIQALTDKSYTTVLRAIESDTSGIDYRKVIDEQFSAIIEHPMVRMMIRPDGLGYMNGSLSVNVIQSWIPVLDLLVDDKHTINEVEYSWVLMNVGPGLNNLLLVNNGDDFSVKLLTDVVVDDGIFEPHEELAEMINGDVWELNTELNNSLAIFVALEDDDGLDDSIVGLDLRPIENDARPAAIAAFLIDYAKRALSAK